MFHFWRSLGIEAISGRLWLSKDGHGLKKWENWTDVNAICMPPKITQKTIITVGGRWWNLFDTFFRTLRGIFFARMGEGTKQWLQHRIQDLKHLYASEITPQRIVHDRGMSWLTYCNALILMISAIFDFVSMYYHHFRKLWNPLEYLLRYLWVNTVYCYDPYYQCCWWHELLFSIRRKELKLFIQLFIEPPKRKISQICMLRECGPKTVDFSTIWGFL